MTTVPPKVHPLSPVVRDEIVSLAVILAGCPGQAHRGGFGIAAGTWCPVCHLYLDCCERVARRAMGQDLGDRI